MSAASVFSVTWFIAGERLTIRWKLVALDKSLLSSWPLSALMPNIEQRCPRVGLLAGVHRLHNDYAIHFFCRLTIYSTI